MRLLNASILLGIVFIIPASLQIAAGADNSEPYKFDTVMGNRFVTHPWEAQEFKLRMQLKQLNEAKALLTRDSELSKSDPKSSKPENYMEPSERSQYIGIYKDELRNTVIETRQFIDGPKSKDFTVELKQQIEKLLLEAAEALEPGATK